MTRHPLRRTRVRYLAHWTVTTKSDHKALFVKVELVRGRKRVVLVLCTANAGGRFDEHDLAMLLEKAPDVLAMQECSDQGYVARLAKKAGYELLDGLEGGQVGQKATPTLIGPRVENLGAGLWVKLLGAVRIGPGAGPDVSKPKWWLRNRLEVEGIRFGASSWHATASQQNAGRWRAAVAEGVALIAATRLIRRPLFVLGDRNSSIGQRFARWLLEHGLTSDQDVLGRVNTHEQRAIDAAMVQAKLVLNK